MVYKRSIYLIVQIILCLFCVVTLVYAQDQINNSPRLNYVIDEKIELKILPPIIDEIQLKQNEMRDTIVLVRTRRGSGSGTIIDCLETDTEGIFEYRVLTNAHITRLRLTIYLQGVDSITGKIRTKTVNTGCEIITFDCQNNDWNQYIAKVIAEDIQYDLAILSFLSDQELAIALIADDEMLKQVRVFDEVFAIGCQLSRAPTPTVGIVSQILTGYTGKPELIVYSSTAQITPGSSGGGLFRKFNDHYYLIGIPYRVDVASNKQFVSHLASAISIVTAKGFLNLNLISCS